MLSSVMRSLLHISAEEGEVSFLVVIFIFVFAYCGNLFRKKHNFLNEFWTKVSGQFVSTFLNILQVKQKKAFQVFYSVRIHSQFICTHTSYPYGRKYSLHRCNHIWIRLYGFKSKSNDSICATNTVKDKSAIVKLSTAAQVLPFNNSSNIFNASSNFSFFISSNGVPKRIVGYYEVRNK